MCICPVLARRRAAARKLKQMTKESKSDDDNNDDNDDDLLSEINIGKMNYLKKKTRPWNTRGFLQLQKQMIFIRKLMLSFFLYFIFCSVHIHVV